MRGPRVRRRAAAATVGGTPATADGCADHTSGKGARARLGVGPDAKRRLLDHGPARPAGGAHARGARPGRRGAECAVEAIEGQDMELARMVVCDDDYTD